MRQARLDRALAGRRELTPVTVERLAHARGRRGFRSPLVDGAVRRELACREIAQPDTIAGRGVTCDGAAEANLDVVGMRTEDEQINRHRANTKDTKDSVLRVLCVI